MQSFPQTQELGNLSCTGTQAQYSSAFKILLMVSREQGSAKLFLRNTQDKMLLLIALLKVFHRLKVHASYNQKYAFQVWQVDFLAVALSQLHQKSVLPYLLTYFTDTSLSTQSRSRLAHVTARPSV